MPWDNNTGGGGRNNNGGGPWGQAPGGGGGGGPRRGNTPSLEDILNRGRDRFQGAGGLPGGRWALAGGVVILAAFWLFNSIYTINPQEVGVETTFGRPSDELSTSGLHFLWWPVQTVERVDLSQNTTEIGSASRNGGSDEGVMLTSDQNIVDAKFSVFWCISDPKAYLYNVRDPGDMVRATAESAMREIVGRSPATEIFRSDRGGIQTEVQQVIQTILDGYKLGVRIDRVNIENVAPPPEVADAFAEVQRAQQDQQKFQEDARTYANNLLGNARGQASKIREDAAAYKSRVVQEAEGEAARFVSVYNEYAKSPEVTRKRLYLETMEQVLGTSDKVIVEPGTSGSGVVPYLPLPALRSQTPTSPTEAAGGN
jgi:membrane protease subunit HflK